DRSLPAPNGASGVRFGGRLSARGAGRASVQPNRRRLLHCARPAPAAIAVFPVEPWYRPGGGGMTPYETLLQQAQGHPFAAIVGWPVEHSRSPLLHGFWLKQPPVAGHYGRLPVEPKRPALEELVAFLRRTPNARGCNLTLPHKIDIMPLLDRIDPLARHIGAVNTVVKGADGSLEGRNSDGFGLMATLGQNAPDWRADAGPVVVLGAGGAARSIVASLADAGVPELRLLNRTRSKAVDLGVAFTPSDGRQIVIERWDERSAV